MGSGEVFSITEDPLTSPGAAEEDEDDEWQDVEISEEWGPQTPMTPLDNDEIDEDTIHPAQQQQRFAVAAVRSIIYHSPYPDIGFLEIFSSNMKMQLSENMGKNHQRCVGILGLGSLFWGSPFE